MPGMVARPAPDGRGHGRQDYYHGRVTKAAPAPQERYVAARAEQDGE